MDNHRVQRLESYDYKRGEDIVSIISNCVDQINEKISCNEILVASGKKRKNSGSPFTGNSNIIL
jgi:hypothetical protein